jgi:hypothetical protein
MNTPEKIAQTYLRLNGFFTIPHFSILQDDWGHVDFLAVRLGGSVEKVGKGEDRIPLKLDTDFFEKMEIMEGDTVGLIVEVKSGEERAEVTDVAFNYVRPVFGNISKLERVGFDERECEIQKRGNHIIVPIQHCLTFIKERFRELERIDHDMRGSGRLSKEGSWYLSEEFLSDLLFLKKSGSL